jgi:Fic family protein
MSYTPPYSINPAILSLVAEIAGEVGRLGALAGSGNVPKLRRENRIRSIHASLAIENNTLTSNTCSPLSLWHSVKAPIPTKSPIKSATKSQRFSAL